MNSESKLVTKAVQLVNIEERLFKISEIELPPLEDDQIAIKVITSTIDTLDYKKIQGKIPNLPLPFTPGLECFGQVIATGAKAKNLMGKHVAAWTYDGSMKSIAISNVTRAVVLPDNVNPEQASMGFMNPLTVLGLLEFLPSGQTLINNSANSCVGRIISRICKFKGIPLINIVRSEEKVKECKADGDEFVLNSSDPNFLKDIQELAEQKNARTFFDSVAGSLTGDILKALPVDSTLVGYGNISGEPIGNIDGGDLRWRKKKIVGFFIPHWILELPENKANEAKEFVAKNYEQLFHAKIGGVYTPEQYKEAFNAYAENTSAGKRVIKFPSEF